MKKKKKKKLVPQSASCLPYLLSCCSYFTKWVPERETRLHKKAWPLTYRLGLSQESLACQREARPSHIDR